MSISSTRVVTIADDTGFDRAISTLALAFGSDPLARWMYGDADQYLLHIRRIFRALGANAFDAGTAHCISGGHGVAFWFPPGVIGDYGNVQAIITESIAGHRQAEVGAAFEEVESYRPREPHWYLVLLGVDALHQGSGLGSALLRHALQQWDRQHQPSYLWSSNPRNTSLYRRLGFEPIGTVQVGSSPPLLPMLRQAR